MASNYQEMKDRVITLIDRDDAEEVEGSNNNTVNWIDVALRNAELRFYRSPAARIPPFEKVVEFTVEPGENTLNVPADYFEGRYAIATVGDLEVTLARVSHDALLKRNTTGRVYLPQRIAYGSNEWLIDSPAQETDIKAYYYGYLDDISEVDAQYNTDNPNGHWLLKNADDLLQFWAGYELSMFYGSIDPQMADRWLQRGNEIAADIVAQEQRQQGSFSTPKAGRPYKRL